MKGKVSEEIKIRRVKGRDFEQMFKLITEGFAREIEIVGSDIERLQRMAKFYRLISNFLFPLNLLNVDFETILVATLNDKVVGEIHLVPHGRGIWSLDSAAVDKNFRGRGIYRKLMQEALDYIHEKHGKKIFTSLWTDNIAPIKITSELQYDVFATETLMIYEPCETSQTNNSQGVLIREAKRDDIEEIFRLCQAAYPKKVYAQDLTPNDFSDSILERIRNRISGTFSKRLAVEVKGRVGGYAYLTYTSPKEAGKIEFLCLLPSVASSELVASLSKYVFNLLAEKNIKKVFISINEEWKDYTEAFKRLGFKPFASIYLLVKELSQYDKDNTRDIVKSPSSAKIVSF